MLGLHCCAEAFSAGSGGYSLAGVSRRLTAVASLGAERRLQAQGSEVVVPGPGAHGLRLGTQA